MTEDTPVCAKPTKKYPDGRTGTRAGYMSHYFAKEESCEECLKGHARQLWQDRRDDPLKNLRDDLWYKYRLSIDAYNLLLAEQGNCCAICGVDAPTDIRTRRFHVDHDHACCPQKEKTCGKCVRGLLCHACNTALGNFKDDPQRLLAAVDYLLKFQSVLMEVKHSAADRACGGTATEESAAGNAAS